MMRLTLIAVLLAIICSAYAIKINNEEYYLESESIFHSTHVRASDGKHSILTSKPVNPVDAFIKANSLSKKRAMVSDDPWDLIPKYQGSVFFGPVASWSAFCFQLNNVTAALSSDGMKIDLSLKAELPVSLTCADWYLFATRKSYFIKSVFFHGEHKMTFDLKEGEVEDLQEHGLRVFSLQGNGINEIELAWSFISLFDGFRVEADNVKFLEEMMNRTFVERPVPIQNIYLDPSYIKSGDFLGITRLDGLDPMIMYFSGSAFGHTATALWMDGELYVCESTAPNPFGSVYWPAPYGVIRTPWKTWFTQAIKANYNVIVMPLRPDLSAMFNATAAGEFFKATEGMPYGFHNFIYTFVDTPNNNLPLPVTSQSLSVALALVDKIVPSQVQLMFIDALNMRFKYYYNIDTQCQSMDCVYQVFQSVNTTLGEAMALPEQDAWTYYDGKSMVCDVFVMSVYKAAGIFGSMADSIQATEFTPKDLYELNIFDSNWQRPAVCDVDNYVYCQILGKYYWDVPTINTIQPYPHMFEHCAIQAPTYIRTPPGC